MLKSVRCYVQVNRICCRSYSSIQKRYDEANRLKEQSVADYYAGKSVFITGGTGFVGKVLIERLLYNCNDIEKLYVMIRQKKGASTDKRLKQMFDIPLFEKLKQVKPDAMSKVVPIEGDLSRDQLAIKPNDLQALVDNVSVVFHSAATVRFNEVFKETMEVNYGGTQKVLELSKKLKNLDTLVYISTAYSNTHKLVIDERIYPPPTTIEEVMTFIENQGEDQSKIAKFLEKSGLPNTYTISKCLCESLVDKERGNIKTVIVRPSIVGPCFSSSLVGWLDTWIATTAIYSDMARGLTRVFYGDRSVVCDMIPVDYVSNFIIAAAAKGASEDDLNVYNICTSSNNPITWTQAASLYLEENQKHPKLDPGQLPASRVIASRSPLVVNSLTFALQTIPAVIADMYLKIKGEPPRHLQQQKRAVLLRDILRKFSSVSWFVRSDKSQGLISSLSDEDKTRFPCDPKTIDWDEYMKIFYRGVQKYMLKRKI